MFNIYHVSIATEPNPENWVTEACFPIKESTNEI
ncbi:MerR family transcriptional regulator [Listeria grandensis FSL F6-0971]|nr:MerR family transcriptional regulator [Listeria grandensis FSL F6-0971]